MMDLWEDYFDFIPGWRRDDVMISYATKGAGIGAHVDDYDVFLVQARGTREWSIENRYLTPAEETRRLLDGDDTKILRNFEPGQKWTLNPGDMLYLPPRVPHRGVALDDECITISMGFRAPSMRSALTAFVDHVCKSQVDEKELYRDCKEDLLSPQQSSGLISINARRSLQGTLREKLLAVLDDDEAFDRWMGEYVTTPLRMSLSGPSPFFLVDQNLSVRGINDEFIDALPIAISCDKYRTASTRLFPNTEHLLNEVLEGKINLRRAEGTRFAHTITSLFVDGEEYFMNNSTSVDIDSCWGGILCDHRELTGEMLRPLLKTSGSFTRLLSSLIRSGYFYPVDK